uniref:Uncharacterized protein n=1 Tax=Marmota marmota marmota TaxID=9994 RepID=A0A8C5Z1C1_MARMA
IENSFLRIFWTVSRTRKFKSRHGRFFLTVLITCWGKALSTFFPPSGGDRSCLYVFYKNVWKIMWLMFWAVGIGLSV